MDDCLSGEHPLLPSLSSNSISPTVLSVTEGKFGFIPGPHGYLQHGEEAEWRSVLHQG